MSDPDRFSPQPREAARAALSADALDFLRRYGLHPDPEAYLAHGYVDLCLRAWPTAGGSPLRLATRWALWTWTTDDLLDGDLCSAPPDAIERLTESLLGVAAGSVRPAPDDAPAVHALAELIRQTRATMPEHWWQRYREQLDAWIVAAHDKLVHYVRPGRTPTLHEYLMLRPADGGMLLAAMWCELAGRCITPDWTDPVVQDLLDAFSTCGILTNDLATGGGGKGETFNAVAARMADGGLSAARARRDVRRRLDAEERRFGWLYSAVRRGFHTGPPPAAGIATGPAGDLVLDTRSFALHLNQFRAALTTWTGSSSRYPATAVPRPASHALRAVLIPLARRAWRAVGPRGSARPTTQ
ncbi:terpene synthase family protein [Kitasatospora sp. NPDC127111]|uniref:terpene synthase family protein n=1 Tax=Kitasatospora sp. NPDC127111 TaxID=3345363 RepID=UPI0036438194